MENRQLRQPGPRPLRGQDRHRQRPRPLTATDDGDEGLRQPIPRYVGGRSISASRRVVIAASFPTSIWGFLAWSRALTPAEHRVCVIWANAAPGGAGLQRCDPAAAFVEYACHSGEPYGRTGQ